MAKVQGKELGGGVSPLGLFYASLSLDTLENTTLKGSLDLVFLRSSAVQDLQSLMSCPKAEHHRIKGRD